jgi:hypothetical protein
LAEVIENMTDGNVSKLANSPVYAMFGVNECIQLNRDHLTKLAAGLVAAVRVRSFFSAEECTVIAEALKTVPLGSYDEELVQPRIAKLGPTAYDYYGDGGLRSEYWAEADQATRARSMLLDGQDPLHLAVERLQKGWTGEVVPATVGGRPLFAGLIREINDGTRMHFDDIAREMPGALDDIPIAQLAFNCHLTMPPTGGDTQVYRRRWSPEDEDHRDGYGYDHTLTQDVPSVKVRAEVGDAVLFDPRNYHTVYATGGTGRRITLSFFIGLMSSGILTVWS